MKTNEDTNKQDQLRLVRQVQVSGATEPTSLHRPLCDAMLKLPLSPLSNKPGAKGKAKDGHRILEEYDTHEILRQRFKKWKQDHSEISRPLESTPKTQPLNSEDHPQRAKGILGL